MKIQTECPDCKSKELSDGKSDVIYDFNGLSMPIQFCNDCHSEWEITESDSQERSNDG